MRYITCDSDKLLELAKNSRGRNRSANVEALRASIDPKGVHLLNMSMLHNDIEMRTWWLIKREGSMEPQDLCLDIDVEMFEGLTVWNDDAN